MARGPAHPSLVEGPLLTRASPPGRPQNGSLILYNRKKVKYRKDGYCWKKRKDGKTTREDHMKLKVKGVEVGPLPSAPPPREGAVRPCRSPRRSLDKGTAEGGPRGMLGVFPGSRFQGGCREGGGRGEGFTGGP